MVERDAHATEYDAAKPGTVQAVRPHLEVIWGTDYPTQALRHGANPFLGKKGNDRIGVLGIQTFNCVCDGIHTARRRESGRQRSRQRRIVDDRTWQNTRIAARALDAIFGKAIYRGHLRPGIGRRDCNDGKRRFQGNGFSQAGC